MGVEAGRGAGTAGAAPVPGGARRAEAGAGAPLQKDLMVLNELHDVMATDALASSHPLSFREDEINTPAQISEVFDSIAYSKVCMAVLGWGWTLGCPWLLSPAVPAGSVGAADALDLPQRGHLQGGATGEVLLELEGSKSSAGWASRGRDLPRCSRGVPHPRLALAHPCLLVLSRSPTSTPSLTTTPSTLTSGSTCNR